MTNYFARAGVLRNPPVKRAAYSDRTAWVMAEICRLVYEPLPEERDIESLVAEIRSAVSEGCEDDVLSGLVRRAFKARSGAGTDIEAVLRSAQFRLVDGFAIDGTEGVVVELAPSDGFEGMVVVAFRGTQPSIADVVTDLKANLVTAPGGGRVHAGFLEAFERVQERIRKAMAECAAAPMYLTGHSLGGALAMVASRYLGSDSTGAAYTFGCPRVADDAFYERVKTPIYRVVNAADGVARIPFGPSLAIFLTALRIVPINGTFEISEWIRKRFAGYTHHGHLVFLSPPAIESSAGQRPGRDASRLVKMSPSIFWRVKTVVMRWVSTWGRAAVSDHSIEQYALKLGEYAEWRNRKQLGANE